MLTSNKIIEGNKNIDMLSNLKITGLKGLISSKILDSQAKGIKAKIEMFEDISENSAGIIDICRIIGILMDNAIEAAPYYVK
jgi:Predicted signal transduction protein with a C-terminal ATPase domain